MIQLVTHQTVIAKAVGLWRDAMLCLPTNGDFGKSINNMGLWGHIYLHPGRVPVGIPNFFSSFRLQIAPDPVTVKIEIPAYQFNPRSQSAVGKDGNGRLYILRRGRLAKNAADNARVIRQSEFDKHARWPSVLINHKDGKNERLYRYYLVACVSDGHVQIRNTTLGFVLECQAIRNLMYTGSR